MAGSKKDRIDLALAATATVKDFVLVTRNIADVRHTRARLLDPYKAPTEWFEPNL